MLSLSEVRFGEAKIGYIFKFKLFNEKDKFESSITITKNYNQRSLKKPPTIKEITEYEKSDISLVSFSPMVKQQEIKPLIFNANSENPNGINLGLDNTYIPTLSKDDEFTIDAKNMSYKQNKQTDPNKIKNPFERLREEAIEKIEMIKNKKEEDEEESEESSLTSSSEENESNENDSSNEGKLDKKSENSIPLTI